jgi:hypothetical protein
VLLLLLLLLLNLAFHCADVPLTVTVPSSALRLQQQPVHMT